MAFKSPVPIPELIDVGPEHEVLPRWLDFHRAYLLSKVDGLDDAQAGRKLLPSLTTLHGLVRHLAWVEHTWFVKRLSGIKEPGPFEVKGDHDGEWRLEKGDGLEADVEVYLAQCKRSREIFAGADLDDTFPAGHGRIVDVRWLMIHMIEEYAQHNGHADIIRELLDGSTSS